MNYMFLVCLTCSVCGTFAVTMGPIFFQTEKNNVTIMWDSQVKTDMSLINLFCALKSRPLKVLFEMIESVEHPESQHQQFAGRVQLDKDALREGRIRLYLSTVTAEDFGNYQCDLAADYDKNTGRWGLQATEHFLLNLTQTSEENVNIAEKKNAADIRHSPGCPTHGHGILTIVGPLLGATALAILVLYALAPALRQLAQAIFLHHHQQ